MAAPLADRLRPISLEDVVGQPHLLGKDKVLRRIIESGTIPNMIFYGPSGVGKTTVAGIIAASTNKKLYKLNATSASISDVKDVIHEIGTFGGYNGILLYLDEIQYFNKKQQQTLLETIENGSITLIASTTENPYFYVYNAILSRSTVFEFRPVEQKDIERAVLRAFDFVSQETGETYRLEEGVVSFISNACGGDVRKAINAVELGCLSALEEKENQQYLSLETVRQLSQKSAMRYDRDADEHYDILSALQKSIRGSDPDAAVHYLARLLEAGDLISPCRRLLVMAAEDVGLAFPQAITIVKSCVDAAAQLGLPEAMLPLSEAALLLATAPKSNSSALAIWSAMEDVKQGKVGEIPDHLKDSHYQGATKLGRGLTYQYAHDYPEHWVKQQYLPEQMKNTRYYRFGENKTEQAAKGYWQRVKCKDFPE